ncbi:MAG: ribonuclease R [Phycisphaerae bacterium]
MVVEKFGDRIVRHLGRSGYRPVELERLAREMGIGQDEYGDFRRAARALMKSGRVVLGSASAVMLPQTTGTITGTFRANPRGFGFVIPHEPGAHGDLYVPQGKSRGAVTGDTVEARAVKAGKRGGEMIYEGRIVEIIERGQSTFVGELCHELGKWFVRPDGNTLHVPIFVADHRAKGAKVGDQVVVEILQYPDERRDARGVIVKLLGKRGKPGVDALSIIHQYHFPLEFPKAVLEAARRAGKHYNPEAVAGSRTDLSDLTVITIDPDDARDFDDAISIRKTKAGLELGVHIADVSHFVTSGSPLDVEARERGNSVYFPRQVIPMLPEVLSNGVCSLQQGEPRLTKSAFITYNGKGERIGARFANTMICSAKRLTYDQATRILDGKTGGFSKTVVALVKQMETLARRIQRRRLRNGMLVLDLPGTEIVFDKQGSPVDVEPEDRAFSHTLIEMFMVEANEVVGELFAELGVPCLRRIHPAPDPASAEPLSRFLTALGLKPVRDMDRQSLQRALKAVAGKPESFAVNMGILRSLEQAVYSPELKEHFALASEHYVHFTSPIRRYPDLTVHRLLDDHVNGRLKKARGGRKKGKRAVAPTIEACEDLGAHCSHRERRAESAERELKLVYILRMLEKELGATYRGVVTGVTNFGIFVQLERFLIDGLLRFDDLGDDWWEVDAKAGCVMGQRTGRRIRIGDEIRVISSGIDLPARKLNLVPEGHVPGSKPRQGPRRAAKGRKQAKRGRGSGVNSKKKRGGRPGRRRR